MVVILPIVISGFKLVREYNNNRNDWHYIAALIGSIALSLVFLAAFFILLYSIFYTPKDPGKI
jgi:hypothetical protein